MMQKSRPLGLLQHFTAPSEPQREAWPSGCEFGPGWLCSRLNRSFLFFVSFRSNGKVNAIGKYLNWWDFSPKYVLPSSIFSDLCCSMGRFEIRHVISIKMGSFRLDSGDSWKLHPSQLWHTRRADTSSKTPEIFTPGGHLSCHLVHPCYQAPIFQVSLYTQKAVFGAISSTLLSPVQQHNNNRTKNGRDHNKQLKFQSPFAHLIFA